MPADAAGAGAGRVDGACVEVLLAGASSLGEVVAATPGEAIVARAAGMPARIPRETNKDL
ncbi:hypothetical protein [Paludisphaera sp.]|uniref:hypothetical protein n=1 Tax=Paludisphaera sp. TaxID=2017432 RepID=UPI00301E3500